VPQLKDECTSARLTDAESSGCISIARNDPYESWKSSTILEDCLRMILTVLEKSGSSGPQNSATAIAMIHVRVHSMNFTGHL
jgi:hypothetical protein